MLIYLSYRKEDSFSISEQFRTQMVERFGEHRLLMNAAKRVYAGSTRAGQISDSVRGCHMMFVLIGPEWAIDAQTGENRFDVRDDPVRLEIETALRYNVPIVPVLVKGAQMPPRQSVPKSLHVLYNYSPHHISPAHLETDIDQLLRQYRSRSVQTNVKKLSNQHTLSRVRDYAFIVRFLQIALLVLGVLASCGIVYLLSLDQQQDPQLPDGIEPLILNFGIVKDLNPFEISSGNVKEFAFSPTGYKIAVVNVADQVSVWDYAIGETTLIGSSIHHLAFHPREPLLYYSQAASMFLNAYSIDKRRIYTVDILPSPVVKEISPAISLNATGTWLALWNSHTIYIPTIESRPQLQVSDNVLSVAFEKEWATMLWVMNSAGLHLWDFGETDQPALQEMLVCEGCTPRDMVVDTENGVVYYLYDDAGQSKIATVSQQNGIEAVIDGPLNAEYIDVSPDGSLIVAGDSPQMVFLTTTDWQRSAIVSTDSNSIVDVQFSPQGDLLAVLDSNGILTLWGVED